MARKRPHEEIYRHMERQEHGVDEVVDVARPNTARRG